MRKRTSEPISEWKDRFLFLGNHLVLDFLNTQPIQNGVTTELLDDFESLLRWFQAAELLSVNELRTIERRWGRTSRAERAIKLARELREMLRKEIISWEAGAAVHRSTTDELNRLMAAYPMRARLKPTDSGVAIERWFETTHPEDMLAPLADRAAVLFAEVSRNSVRKCAECVLHFRDTSKKGTRRWCSMRLCGNRLKVAAYAARQRMPER